MLVKDFEFRIVPKPNEKGEYCNCNNADCPAKKFHFLVGNEAKSRLSDENLQDCKIELWTGKVDENNKKAISIYEHLGWKFYRSLGPKMLIYRKYNI